jgi:hypothetical protein
LARCLDQPGKNLSLKEPAALMAIANLKRTQGADLARAWLKPTLSLLARPLQGEEAVTIKPTNIVNNLICDVVDLSPDSRHILLTSDLRSFLVSIVKKGEGGRGFARKLFTIFAMDGHAVAKANQVQLMRMSDLQVAALVWHMQITTFMEAMKVGGNRFAWMDGDEFVQAPAAALEKVDQFFDIGLGAAHATNTAAGPLLGRDAKNPGKSYGPDRRASEAQAIIDQLGPDLDAVIDWSFTVFPQSPRNGRLQQPLMS